MDFEVIGKIVVDETGAATLRGIGGPGGVLDQIHQRTGLLSSVTSAFGDTARYVWANLVLGGVQSVIRGVGEAIGTVKDFFDSSMQSAKDSQNVIADLEATLKSTGGAAGLTSQELQDMAEQLQNVTRFSDETIIRGESMLLTFTSIGKDIFPQATETMLNLAQKMGTDASQAAIQLGKALNDPITGVGALRRVGVQFTEDQQELIKTLVEEGDLLSAQKIILKELEVEFGGVARAAGSTFAGQLDIAMNKLDNFKELVGGPLLQAISSLKVGFLEWVMDTDAFHAAEDFLTLLNENIFDKGLPFFNALAATFQDIGSHSDYISNLNPILGELASAFSAVQSALDSGMPLWEALWAGVENLAINEGPLQKIGDFFVDIKDAFDTGGIGGAIDTFFGKIFGGMADAVDGWVAGGGPEALIDKIVSWIDGIGADEGTSSKTFAAIGRLVGALAQAIDSVDWSALSSALSRLFTRMTGGLSFQEVVQRIVDTLTNALASADWDSVGNTVSRVVSGVIETVLGGLYIIVAKVNWGPLGAVLTTALKEVFVGAADGLLLALAHAFGDPDIATFQENVKIGAERLKNILIGFLFPPASLFLPQVRKEFFKIGEGIWEGIADGLEGVGLDFFADAIRGLIRLSKTILGIASASTVFAQIGRDMVAGLLGGWMSAIGGALSTIKDSLSGLIGDVKDTVGGATGSFGGFGGSTGGGGGSTGGGGGGTTIIQNFYGTVYMGSKGETYDCPPNNPLTSSTYSGVSGSGSGR